MEWIRTDDRLPELNKKVTRTGRSFVCDEGWGVLACGVVKLYSEYPCVHYANYDARSNQWWEGDNSEDPEKIENVTHWMPLPEPPADA